MKKLFINLVKLTQGDRAVAALKEAHHQQEVEALDLALKAMGVRRDPKEVVVNKGPVGALVKEQLETTAEVRQEALVGQLVREIRTLTQARLERYPCQSLKPCQRKCACQRQKEKTSCIWTFC